MGPPITLTSASGGWNCIILSPKLPFPMLLKVLSNRSLGASTQAKTTRLHQPKSWLLHHKWVGCWFPSIAQDQTIPSCLQWSLTSWQKSYSKRSWKEASSMFCLSCYTTWLHGSHNSEYEAYHYPLLNHPLCWSSPNFYQAKRKALRKRLGYCRPWRSSARRPPTWVAAKMPGFARRARVFITPKR